MTPGTVRQHGSALVFGVAIHRVSNPLFLTRISLSAQLHCTSFVTLGLGCVSARQEQAGFFIGALTGAFWFCNFCPLLELEKQKQKLMPSLTLPTGSESTPSLSFGSYYGATV